MFQQFQPALEINEAFCQLNLFGLFADGICRTVESDHRSKRMKPGAR